MVLVIRCRAGLCRFETATCRMVPVIVVWPRRRDANDNRVRYLAMFVCAITPTMASSRPDVVMAPSVGGTW